MTIAIYLAHLNPVTNAHAEIIKDLVKKDDVIVMPVRFLVGDKEINSKSFPFSFEIIQSFIPPVLNAITGIPLAKASSITLGKLSSLDGNKNKSAKEYMLFNSFKSSI